ARHRRPGPRHHDPGLLRDPRLAAGRAAVRGAGHPGRRPARPGLGLLGLAGLDRLPADRPDAGVPVPDHRRRAGGHQRSQPRQRGHRLGHRADPDHDPRGPRGDAAVEGGRLHPVRPRLRCLEHAHPRPAHPAQHGGGHHRPGHGDHAGVDHRRGHAVLPGPGHHPTGLQPGDHAVRRPAVHLPVPRGGRHPRPGHRGDLPGLQLLRRRPPGRPGPDHLERQV
ncbi:MAG: Dipeptide transport system permease protein DppC, partial [uncultured Friedmanniella sp.]